MNYIKECNRLNRNPNNLLELLELELSRTKFYLKSYLRQRLLKIEEYSDHLSFTGGDNCEEKEDLMAIPELEYLQQYQDLKQRFLQKSSTMNLPTPLQSSSSDGGADALMMMMKKPDLAKHVFVRVKESIGDCLLSQGT
jgi:GINS complex subunit 4